MRILIMSSLKPIVRKLTSVNTSGTSFEFLNTLINSAFLLDKPAGHIPFNIVAKRHTAKNYEENDW